MLGMDCIRRGVVRVSGPAVPAPGPTRERPRGHTLAAHAVRVVVWVAIGLTGLAATASATAGPREQVSFAPGQVPAPPEPRPGAVIGSVGGAVLLAGGVDPGGAASSAALYRRPEAPSDAPWETWALPQPAAFAAVAAHGDTLYAVGGLDAGRLLASGSALTRVDGEPQARRLPDLPEPTAMAGAAVLDDALYVVGGLQTADPARATGRLYRLDLKNPAARWEALDALPGPARLLPAVSGVYNQLNVVGGFVEDPADAAAPWQPQAETWRYRARPIDGTRVVGWQRGADAPRPLAASGAWATGQAHLMILGGYVGPVSLDQVIAADPAAPRTAETAIYHTITDTWVPAASLPRPTAAAAVVVHGGQALLIPGASTADDAGDATGDDAAAPPTLSRIEVHGANRQLGAIDYAVIGVYFLGVAGIGVWFARRQTSSEEFALGGRNVKWWAAGISMFATGASSISFMAIPAQTYRTNLVWLAPLLLAIIPVYFFQAHVVYPLLRRLRLTSTYEYLEQRYNNPLRVLASFQSIMFQLLGRMSVVMLLPALAISAVTGLNVYMSVALMGLLTTVYTAIGGFEAVIWTDVTQGLLMMFGCILMIVLAVVALPGGMGEFVATSSEYGRLDWAIWELDWTLPVIWIAAISIMMTTLGFAADQPTVQRVYATPMKDMRRLAAMFALCSVVIAVLVNVTGLSLFSYFHAFPEQLDVTMTNDQIVPLYVVQRLPVGVAGLIVAALFAASMSTLSSSMNSVATLVSEDFYRRYFPDSTDASRLRLMKLSSLGAGLFGTGVSLYMARMNITSMFQTWNEIVALLGGGFVGIYILGMFTTRASSAGAIVGALASVAAAILIKGYTEIHWIFYAPAAILSCVVVGYLASLILPGPARDLTGLTIFTPARALTDEELIDA